MYGQNNQKEDYNWNNIFKLGVEIKKSYLLNDSLIGKYDLPKEELEFVSNEIFNNLKGKFNFSFSLIIRVLLKAF